VTTIRSELKNSQDEMVQALYPITGRLVKAYVASAIKDLTDQINRRIEQNPLSLRIRSWTTGKPVAELAIAESQRLKVEEIFLIRRGAGSLLGRWPEGPELSNSDIHLSGVLSAINDFSSHAFEDDGGNLRTFKFDDFHVYLRASPMYLVAAKCRGIPASGVESVFDEAFLDVTERLEALPGGTPNTRSGVETGTMLEPMAAAVEQGTGEISDANDRAGLGFNPVRLLAFLVLVPLLAWGIWWAYTSAEAWRTLHVARGVVAGIPALEGYTTRLDVGYRGHSLKVIGLTPDSDVRARLLKQLGEKLSGTKIQPQLAVLPTPALIDTRPQVERLRHELSTLEADTLSRRQCATPRVVDG